MVEPSATIQMQPIMMRARLFDSCNFKGHQIARNLKRKQASHTN